MPGLAVDVLIPSKTRVSFTGYAYGEESLCLEELAGMMVKWEYILAYES